MSAHRRTARCGVTPLCPDLVVELASPGDQGARGVSDLRRKMPSHQANGARLGGLLLPEQRAVEIRHCGPCPWPVPTAMLFEAQALSPSFHETPERRAGGQRVLATAAIRRSACLGTWNSMRIRC